MEEPAQLAIPVSTFKVQNASSEDDHVVIIYHHNVKQNHQYYEQSLLLRQIVEQHLILPLQYVISQLQFSRSLS